MLWNFHPIGHALYKFDSARCGMLITYERFIWEGQYTDMKKQAALSHFGTGPEIALWTLEKMMPMLNLSISTQRFSREYLSHMKNS